MKKLLVLLFTLILSSSMLQACGPDPCDEWLTTCGKCTDTAKTACEAAQKLSSALPIGRTESCKAGNTTYTAQCK